MVAATVLYTGDAGDTAAIITAVGTNAFSTLQFLLGGVDGHGLIILLQGS